MENLSNKRGHREVLVCGYWDEREGWVHAGSSCKEVGGFYSRNFRGVKDCPKSSAGTVSLE